MLLFGIGGSRDSNRLDRAGPCIDMAASKGWNVYFEGFKGNGLVVSGNGTQQLSRFV